MARIVKAASASVRVLPKPGSERMWKHLTCYRAGMEPVDCVRVRFSDREWSHGEVLDHLSRTGRMPDSFKRGIPRKRTAPLREALGIGEEGRWYRPALFPTVHEVYAAMILLVDAKGLNLSVMARLKVSDIARSTGAEARTLDLQRRCRQAPPQERQVLIDHVRWTHGGAVAADGGHRRAGPRHA